MAKRRNFTDQFKAKVALEALRGDKTVQEIAAKHQLHPNQVSTWKRQAIDGIADQGFLAIIAPHKKAKPCENITAGAVAQNEALRTSTHPGRELWSRWRGYHRRSHVETEMYRVKSLGQRLLVRDSTARSQSSRFALPP